MDLFADIDLLSLDAGNTVIFLDHARLEKIARGLGHDEVRAAKLIETEGKAKRGLGGEGDVVEIDWAEAKAPGARGWGIVMATMFEAAGVSRGDLARLLEALWESHVDHNLYSKVPRGFVEAMEEIRGQGVVAIVSNSEGMLDRLFDKLGILSCFDAVVDSAKVGIEKPDARIFEIACKRTGTTPEHALHLGDTMATDIIGARNAKMRCAMIDPFGHYEGMYPDVPRAEGVVEVAREIMRSR